MFLNFSIFLYIASLPLLAIYEAGNKASATYGYEALLFGWLQTYFGVVDFIDAFPESLSLLLPWYANPLYFLAIYFHKLNWQASFKTLSIACVLISLVFFIQPVAMVGEVAAQVRAKPSYGAYLWLLSFIFLLIEAYFGDNLNKSKQQGPTAGTL